jgi:FtsZ-binding cell division protein ZapB
MWIRVPTLVSDISPEIKSFLNENGIQASAMSVCFDVTRDNSFYNMIQRGLKVRSDVHTVECDQLLIDSLKYDNQRLIEHAHRCEAVIRSLRIQEAELRTMKQQMDYEMSRLSQRLATYEHILKES